MSSSERVKKSLSFNKSQLPTLPISGMPKFGNFKPQMRPQALIGPLQAMASGPAVAWEKFKSWPETTKSLFEKYVFVLSVIPAVAGFVGRGILGSGGFFSSLIYSVVGYGLCLCFLYAAVIFASMSAKMFDGEMSLDNAAKLIVYSFIPFFIASAFLIHSSLSMLSLVGAYGFLLLYYGIKELSGVPAGKIATYYMVNVVAWIVVIDLTIMFF